MADESAAAKLQHNESETHPQQPGTAQPGPVGSGNAGLDALLAQAAQADQNNELTALTAQLQKAQARKGEAGAGDGLLFGFTFGALMVGLVVSTLGLAYIKYGRSTTQPIVFFAGFVLLAVPFFVTDAGPLAGVGAAIALTPLLTKRIFNIS